MYRGQEKPRSGRSSSQISNVPISYSRSCSPPKMRLARRSFVMETNGRAVARPVLMLKYSRPATKPTGELLVRSAPNRRKTEWNNGRNMGTTMDRVIGVITSGRISPRFRFVQTWRSSQGLGSGMAVMGLAWRNQSTPSRIAHSISCGEPSFFSMRRTNRPSRRTDLRSSEDSLPTRFWRIIVRFFFCRRKRSGWTVPETRASPRPWHDSITIRLRLPVTGSRLKATPAASGSICC